MNDDNRIFLIMCRGIVGLAVIVAILVLGPIMINVSNSFVVLLGIVLTILSTLAAVTLMATPVFDSFYLKLFSKLPKGDK